MLVEAERVWRSKSDEELAHAAAHLGEYTEEGEQIIRAELALRGMPSPPPTIRKPEPAPSIPTKTKSASPDAIVSHWAILIEGLQASPKAFYKSLEEALSRRQIPETSNARVEYRESGLLSAKREYLRVMRGSVIVDFCAAPFGTGFFVSEWVADARPSLSLPMKLLLLFLLVMGVFGAIATLGIVEGLLAVVIGVPVFVWLAKAVLADSVTSPEVLADVPIIGWVYRWLFREESTYYRMDSAMMFQKAVHSAVLEVVDEFTKAKGLRALSESERKPIMREFGRNALA